MGRLTLMNWLGVHVTPLYTNNVWVSLTSSMTT
jgi:hypothetical protein